MVSRIDTDEARTLIDAGAQVVEVLPEPDYREEHLPGAVSIPLTDLTADAIACLDPRAPTVVYCYDTQCDLSGRGTARLVHLGFTDVHDYTGSKTAWLAMGWPAEGTKPDDQRAGAIASAAITCEPATPIADLPDAGPGGIIVVVDAEGLVLGTVEPATLPPTRAATAFDVAHPAPTSVRPSITVDELARSMDEAGEAHVLVTTFDGTLLGVAERSALRVDR
jgi:rhodanese-related sulfurtransferase